MIYFANPNSDAARDAMIDRRLGCITTPSQGNVTFPDEWDVIADNGCFGGRWEEGDWHRWLIGLSRSVRWAVAPDVFDPSGAACHQATVERWERYAPMMRRHGFTPAFVAQVGCSPTNLPDDAEVVFLGGTDDYKLGPDGASVAVEAKRRGCWLHMGRVNSWRRLTYADRIGCDSVDGTYIARWPDTNLPKLLEWVDRLETKKAHPRLFPHTASTRPTRSSPMFSMN